MLHFLFSVILVLLVPSSARAQQQTDLDAFATRAATAIHKSKKSNDTKVLVIDFAGMNSKVNALGSVLADQFADSLRKTTKDFVVMDRADYARATAEDRLTPEARAEAPSANCYCWQLGADFVVLGTIDTTSDKLPLTIQITRPRDWKTVFSGTVSLSLTPELRAYLSKPAYGAPLSLRSNDKNSWTNPNPSPGTSDLATAKWPAGVKASVPSCIYCPTAHYTDAAVKARVQGTVDLNAVIDSQGNIASMSVVRGLACGLNSKAIETVKEWRLKPAVDPNGNPVAVRQLIEMTFHLY